MDDDKPRLDPTLFDEIIEQGGTPEFVFELVGVFAADVSERMKALHDAVANGDEPTMVRVAHGIKGAASNVGGVRMAALAERLEHPKPGADLGAIERQLTQEFPALQTELAARYGR